MKLIIQPDAGVAPIVTAIKQAKKSVDVTVFRLDRSEIMRAIEAAVGRGVSVRALIANTHSGSDKVLRKLELRLLATGVTVSRTADDLVRYHGKMMMSDDAMLRLIRQRINAGVDVRIVGRVEAKWKVCADKFPGRRLHIRAIMRDGRRAFLGSQSLRRLELEKRREIGIIVNDKRVVRQMIAVFEQDWAQTGSGKKEVKKETKKAEKAETSAKAEKKGGREPARTMAAAS